MSDDTYPRTLLGTLMCLQIKVQVDGRIVDCANESSAGDPSCSTPHASASASESGPSSGLAVSSLLAGAVAVTHNALYSILPFSFTLVADCAATQ